jgi:Zn ribbon nucleic-acid-binding protein
MEMRMRHSTALCPKCGKDSYQSEHESYFSVVTCIWCGAQFIGGKVIEKESNKKG